MTGNNAQAPGVTADELIRSLMALVNAGPQASRQFVVLPILRSEKDLRGWNAELRRTLERHGLLKYIDEDVPEPEDKESAAYKIWLNDRADIQDLLSASCRDNAVFDAMCNCGWKPDEINPHLTYKKAFQALEKSSPDAGVVLWAEYTSIKRSAFDTFAKFTERLQYLRRRLEALGSPLPAQAHIWNALNAVKDVYPDKYDRWMIRVEEGTLTWDSLIADFMAQANTELSTPNTVNVKIEVKTSGKNNNNKNKDEREEPPKPCTKCNKRLYRGQVHCPGCDRHIRGKICWWCKPDDAPDNWPYKAEALKLKAGKVLSTKSSTGPLYQRSGVNTPSTQTQPTSNSFLYSTNFNTNNIDYESEGQDFC
ncbi:hypothetical protein V8F06_012834 [Rhypophila decipiens]